MKLSKKLSALILAAAFTALPLMANAQQPAEDKPIVLKTMGSLFFGGTVQTLPNGEIFHGLPRRPRLRTVLHSAERAHLPADYVARHRAKRQNLRKHAGRARRLYGNPAAQGLARVHY